MAYRYQFDADAELPFEFPYFWIYVRIYQRNSVVGRKKFTLEVYYRKPDGNEVLTYTRPLPAIRF